MKTRRQETHAVKSALIAAGYSGVTVRHGNGTTWGWLHIRANLHGNGPRDWRAQHDAIRRLAETRSGRDTDSMRAQITIELQRRED